MSCFHPLKAYRSLRQSPKTGKYPVIIVPRAKQKTTENYMSLPCGNCIGCRMDYARNWAIRCMHEAHFHKHNSFITLTYNQEHLPFDHSLNKAHFQKFMKRLRKNTGKKIRYYMCGEYGEKLGRPHYHACLFGLNFAPDQTIYKLTDQGETLYNSPTLDQAWSINNSPIGYAVIGDLTFQSAAYVARYIMKKVNGKHSDEHYTIYDDADNPWVKQKEYTTMSRGDNNGSGGIASRYYEKYKHEIFATDSVIFKGRELKPPRYYSQRYEIDEPEHLEIIKNNRISAMNNHKHDNTPSRLKSREKVKQVHSKKLIRQLEVIQ